MNVELRELAIKRCLTNLVSNALRYGTKVQIQAIRGRTSVEIMDILQRLNEEEGLTVVLVTHEQDIAQYAKRALDFRDGKLRRDTPVRDRLIAREVLPTLPSLQDDDAAGDT